MRKFAALSLFLVLAAVGATAGTNEFVKGAFYLTPQVGLYSWGGSIPFGAAGEFALTPNIGLGGSVMVHFWSEDYWSQSILSFSAEVLYHFTGLKAEKFDLFAGGGLGYSVYSWKWKSGFEDWIEGSSGASGLYLNPILGARYWFSPKLAVSLRLISSLLGSWTGFGGQLGLTFRAK
ncbi:MAG: hypothetical protein FJY80_03910 [Candidatus Aminicenantes bacterium]|nr:hypothetical protein [Candidatus Aminicenantes bacterium]